MKYWFFSANVKYRFQFFKKKDCSQCVLRTRYKSLQSQDIVSALNSLNMGRVQDPGRRSGVCGISVEATRTISFVGMRKNV